MEPYVNCKFEALRNVLQKFNKDYRILLNNLIPYIYIEAGTLKIGAGGFENYEELFLKNGMLFSKVSKVNDFRKLFKDSINSDSAVIIKTDLFYQPYSLKYYNKIHRTHNLYIYGYDANTGVVNTVEQEYSGSSSYVKMNFSIEKVEELYFEYLKNYYDTGVDIEDTVITVKLLNETENIPKLRETYRNDLAVFCELFDSFDKLPLAKKSENLEIAIRFKNIRYELSSDDREIIRSQIQCLNKIKRLIIKNDSDLLKKEIESFINCEYVIFSKYILNRNFIYRYQDKFYYSNSKIQFDYNKLTIKYISDKYVICDIRDEENIDNNYIYISNNLCEKILLLTNTPLIYNNKMLQLKNKADVEFELKSLEYKVEYINYQNNSINGCVYKNTNKYFFKVLQRQEAEKEINGYFNILGRMPVAELTNIVMYDNCTIIFHRFSKEIGKNEGLFNDFIISNEIETNVNTSQLLSNIISEYTKNWDARILRKNYPMEKFYLDRVDNRLMDWYAASEFLDKKICINGKYYNVFDIFTETKKYFKSMPTEVCVLTQGDPNLLNIGTKPIFFDYSTSGYNSINGEIAAFFWSTILADAYFCPKYHGISYKNHENALERMGKFKPIVKLEKKSDAIYINISPKTSKLRKDIIRLIINKLENFDISFEIKYFFAMRLLCVLNIEGMEEEDKYSILAILILIYNEIGKSEKVDLNNLLNLFEEE